MTTPVPEPTHKDEDGTPRHSVADAIDRYLHGARDVKFAARVFIPTAGKLLAKQSQDLKIEFDQAQSLMGDTDLGKRAHGLKLAFSASRRSQRLNFSKLPDLLESSLFISLFSSFDVFTGELLSALHLKKPALFDRLNRSIPLSKVLSAASLESLKLLVLDEEIETFRRKSYPEQFDYLETAFGVPVRKFTRWSDFVEAGQRRNLLTHCDGIASEQYRSVCQKEGYPVGKLATVGMRLELGADYFLPTCELMYEVALKLGQTLWRKVLPDDLDAADSHLMGVVYDALSQEQWERAEIAGEFFTTQKNLSSDLNRRMATVNYAIALKHREKLEEMKRTLSAHDWSASIPEFRLAEAVLLNRTDEAIQFMKSVGPEGQLLKEHSYHSWPLFRDFRELAEFQQAYEAIYGYPFVAKVQSVAREERQALEGPTEAALTGQVIADRAEAAVQPTQ